MAEDGGLDPHPIQGANWLATGPDHLPTYSYLRCAKVGIGARNRTPLFRFFHRHLRPVVTWICHRVRILWWSRRESNPSHSACKASSPPWNMRPHLLVANMGIEPIAERHELSVLPLHQLAPPHIENHENKSIVLHLVSEAEHMFSLNQGKQNIVLRICLQTGHLFCFKNLTGSSSKSIPRRWVGPAPGGQSLAQLCL